MDGEALLTLSKQDLALTMDMNRAIRCQALISLLKVWDEVHLKVNAIPLPLPSVNPKRVASSPKQREPRQKNNPG